MRTDDLITSLVAELKPVRRGAPTRLLVLAFGCGVVAASGLMLGGLGLRPDLHVAMTAAPFWMKAAYTIALALFGFWLVERVGRPGARVGPLLSAVFLVAAIMMLAGAIQTLRAPAALRWPMFLGGSYAVCPILIVALAIPILFAMLIGLRRMAPTRLVLSGALAGLLAGAAGAGVYGLHCTESSALFVAVWYTLGIAATTALGALCGRVALRW
jgi:hypothetical protein